MVHPSDFELDQASDWELERELASEFSQVELLGSTGWDNMDLDSTGSGSGSMDSSGLGSMDSTGLGLGSQPF